MYHVRLVSFLLLIITQRYAVSATAMDLPSDPVMWHIVHNDDRWQLLKDGKRFFVKGAVGWNRFDVLRACGGNAVRTTARRDVLDAAYAEGPAVMANLPVRGERNGMDWGDEQQVDEQNRRVLRVVRELRDHPAVMFWAVGNELDHVPGRQSHHPQLWKRLNELAVAIKEIDHKHPVMTVIGTGRFPTKIREIATICGDIDLLGINTYGDIDTVTELARTIWDKPYVLAEWGPTGHWQVPKTPWKAPLEQTSSEKALTVRERYEKSILTDHTHCLGSFVFYWSEKQETTHTWYGLFRVGMRTESIDVMQKSWSGQWPANRAPAIEHMVIEGYSDPRSIYVQPARIYGAVVQASDPDSDPLTFSWEIRPEVEIPPGSYAGSLETKAEPIEGLFQRSTGHTVEFSAPQKTGAYRLFVTILDGHGHAAYANIPFFVREP